MTRLHGRAVARSGSGSGGAGQILATWLNDSSTGVSRPKMETRTLSFWLSTLISELVAGRVSKGPSVTVTDSPTENSTWTAGEDDGALPLSADGVLASMVGASMDMTSSSVSGTGERELPTNPVTPGV